tara:strand:- start:120 stop:1859 length:1740 start_codon:yes stop_codon:yes gene_type:complete
MLDFLLTDTTKKTYLEHYIKVICDGSSISTDFLKKYFKRNDNLSILIPIIVDSREVIIDDIGFSNSVSEELLNFRNFIKYIPFSRYQELDYLRQEFRRELSFMANYAEFILECFDGNFDRFKAFTDVVQPVLENANFSKSQVEELNWLGESKYLAINKHMIKQVLVNNLEYSQRELIDLENKPLSIISRHAPEYLTKDLWSDNLNKYILVFLQESDDQVEFLEEEVFFIKALNSLQRQDPVIEGFIKKVSIKIGNINKIEDYDLKKNLINSSKVESLWSNVFKYFSDCYYDEEGDYRVIDSALINFLEGGRDRLKTVRYSESEMIDIEDWNNAKEEFDERFFACNSLSDETYGKLIGITDNNWDNSNLEDINQEKAKTLIRLGKLSLTSENWEQVKKYASKEVILDFLVKYHQTIIHDLDSIELRPEDIEALFCSDEIINQHKQVLAESKAINLIESNETVRKKIIEIYESERMSLPVYDQLLKHADSEELRKLLLKQIRYLDKQEILEILKLLDEPYKKLANGQEVEFENTDENYTLLRALNTAQIVMRIPKPTRPKSNPVGKKILSTRLQTHVLSDE